MATDQQQWERWFTHIWEQREEHFYRKIFGDLGPTIHTIPPNVFSQFTSEDPDPRWLTHGVFACPPGPGRPSWAYVTSALSNPWGQDPEAADPEAYSGLGFEFIMRTQEQADWAIHTLHWLMALQILTACGLIKGELLECNDLIPLGGPIAPAAPAETGAPPTLLRNLLITEPDDLPAHIQLDSGKVDLFACVGITDREMEFATSQGVPGLLVVLKHKEIFPLTDPARQNAL